MSDSGPTSAYASPTSPPSHNGLKIVGGVVLVLAIGGVAYGIASALGQGGPTPASTTTPNTTAPPGRAAGGGSGRAPFARPQATGTVQSVGTSSFVLRTVAGTNVTVQVSAKTSYSDSATASSSYSDVKTGERVAAYGTVAGSTVSATRILIIPAGGRGGAGGFRGGFGGAGGGTVGTVKSVGSNSFVITTVSGSTVTVDVSGSTKYSDRGSSSAGLSDVKVGGRVVVTGSGTTTVKATEVFVIPTGGFRGGAGGGFGGGSGGFGGGSGAGSVSG